VAEKGVLGFGKGINFALDSNGMIHIIFGNMTYNDSEYERSIYYSTNDSGYWSTEKIASFTGEDDFPISKIVLDSKDKPHISYVPYPLGLRYAYKDSTGWHIEIINEENVYYSLMTLDSSDNPHIIYEGEVNVFTRKGKFKHSYKDSRGWHTELINEDNVQNIFEVLYTENNLHLLYEGEYQLRYAYKGTTGWNIELINEDTGHNPSMTLDSRGNPFISYTLYPENNPVFYYVHKDDAGWHTEEFFDELGFCSWYSISLDSEDNPHLSYRCNKRNYLWETFKFHTGYILKYAKRVGAGWQIETVDRSYTFAIPWLPLLVNVFGNHISNNFSMALDLDGEPHIVYLKNCFNYFTSLYLFSNDSEPNDSAGTTSLKHATRFDFVD
jgi:hypothetical protein